MKPDTTLANILWTVSEYNKGNKDFDYDLLIKQIQALDEWLSKGGFLPLRWKREV